MPPVFRSLIYVPADKPRALAKARGLVADAIIVDLEDAVAPDRKEDAREALREALAEPFSAPVLVRINGLSSEWATEDLLAALAARPEGLLVPKVESAADLERVADALDQADALDRISLWAMIETPKALLNLAEIAASSEKLPLKGFVLGLNDLAKETGVRPAHDRGAFLPWMMSVIAAARAYGLVAIDGVLNDFGDDARLEAECEHARALGFDGKSLIHPRQIDTANRIFAPSAEEIAEAETIVEAFARPENAGKGAIGIEGRMVERLHLHVAESLLARARAIADRDQA
ncbi:citrate lyase subunit beta/citryl-CoA lyase [Rhodopseudomonas julia]|uniref:Citrate lyase subunit beta/citryl-CoA lyase n=1 Tax=Rhodopseudomonas julia TaxID=200617 RepID=A0ABU0C4Y3_9BRAD|nr:CoA ester lyase [Rhodopseudomonas julia]MDQ0325576.1 citrate lyase subunit beta/citryl-CoA lyase [Rhodopseudomonas julia]